jgi:uncharacterized protein YjiK
VPHRLVPDTFALATLALLLGATSADAQQLQPWPAEPWTQAVHVPHLDPDWRENLSGAHWNPVTRTLWVVCNNPPTIWALEEDGTGGWRVANKGGLRGEFEAEHDSEGITQADYNEEVVYVIDEDRSIYAYETSTGGVRNLQRSWWIGFYLPFFSGGNGPEGIAFVPDAWLQANGFVDPSGQPRTSRRGMGGLMFVAHQEGGHLYVFDLDRSGGFDFVGEYETAYDESSGLEFDRSTGKLYVWHNTAGNVIEVCDLSSTGSGVPRMNTLELIQAPKSLGNLEGIACTPDSSGEGWWWFTDDANHQGAALMWFKDFPVRMLTATAGPRNPGDGAVDTAEQDAPMLQLRLEASGSDAVLTRLAVHTQGTGDDASEVTEVRLWWDADGSGSVTAGDAPLGTPTVFGSDDGVAEFSGLSDVVTAGTTRDYLVTYSLAAAGGVTFQAWLDPAVDLSATSGGAAITAQGAGILAGAQRTPAVTSTTAPGATPGASPQPSTTPTTAVTTSRSSGGCSLTPAPAGRSGAWVLLLAGLLLAGRARPLQRS